MIDPQGKEVWAKPSSFSHPVLAKKRDQGHVRQPMRARQTMRELVRRQSQLKLSAPKKSALNAKSWSPMDPPVEVTQTTARHCALATHHLADVIDGQTLSLISHQSSVITLSAQCSAGYH